MKNIYSSLTGGLYENKILQSSELIPSFMTKGVPNFLLILLQLHIQIGDEIGIRSSELSPKDRMTLQQNKLYHGFFLLLG